MAQTEKSVKKRRENKNKIVALNGMSWISFNPKYNKRKIRMGVFRVEASYLLEIEERCPLYLNEQFLCCVVIGVGVEVAGVKEARRPLYIN